MLEIDQVVKRFPGVCALDHVSCRFESGEIHALLGENGAGKSTLMKIICGIYKQDEGSILVDGVPVHFSGFQDALKQGISIVNQEIQIVMEASIAENIMLDKLDHYTKFGKIDWKRLNQDTQHYLDMLGVPYAPTTRCKGLNPATKQLIQIAKALSSDAKYLLLDEPTSCLTLSETAVLFQLLRQLKGKGISLIFVSHKLDEVLEICDKLTVLRDGKLIGTRDCSQVSKTDIVEMMIGRKTNDEYLGKLEIDYTRPTLEVRNLCQKGRFQNISFSVYPGEILGFYGLVGSGRTELARAIFGDTKIDQAEILLKGTPVSINSISQSVNRLGIGYVSENRKEDGLILDFDIKQNTGITIWQQLKKTLVSPINAALEKSRVREIVKTLDVKATGIHQIVGNLSGGNQQKISIGKWLARGCEVLFIDEPTIGVDVGAKEYIHKLIWDLASKQKKAIVLISSDMTELVKLSRRILIFKSNQIVAELNDLNHEEGQPFEEVSKAIGTYLT